MTYDTINNGVTIAGNSTGTMLANRYRVVRQLGGGMGSVWLVEDVTKATAVTRPPMEIIFCCFSARDAAVYEKLLS